MPRSIQMSVPRRNPREICTDLVQDLRQSCSLLCHHSSWSNPVQGTESFTSPLPKENLPKSLLISTAALLADTISPNSQEIPQFPIEPEEASKCCQGNFSRSTAAHFRKGFALTCSETISRNRSKSEHIGSSEQIGTNPENKERKLEQIGRKRGTRNKSG